MTNNFKNKTDGRTEFQILLNYMIIIKSQLQIDFKCTHVTGPN